MADIHSIASHFKAPNASLLEVPVDSQLLSRSSWDCPSMLVLPFPVLNCFLVLLRLDIEMRDGLSGLPHDCGEEGKSALAGKRES